MSSQPTKPIRRTRTRFVPRSARRLRAVQVILVAVVSWAGFAQAEAPTFVEQRWTIDNGLPVRALQALAATDDGMIWIGSHDGLIRFDGTTFDVFRAGEGALPRQRIEHVYVRTNGDLQIVDDLGNLVQIADGHVSEPMAVTGAFEWNGRAAAVQGRSVFDMEGTPLVTLPEVATGVIGAGPYAVFSTARGASVVLDPDGQILPVELPAGSLPLAAYREGRVLFATGDGLALWEAGQLTPLSLEGLGNPGEFCQGAYDRHGTAFVRSTLGWWAVTDRVRPLQRWDEPRHCSVHLATGPNGHMYYADATRLFFRGVPVAIVHAPISGILPRPTGDVFLATVDGLIGLRKPRIEGLPVPEGLIFTVLADNDGDLWTGVWRQGLLRIGADGSRSMVRLDDPTGLINVLPTSLFEDEGGTIWAGTWSGLHREADQGFVPVGTPPRDEETGAAHRAIVRDSHGDLWLGRDDGLFKKSGSDWEQVGGLPTDLRVYAIQEHGSNLWIGTSQGLFRGPAFQRIPLDRGGVPHVRSLTVDSDNTLWATTEEHGVCEIRDGVPRCVGTENGLFRDGVHCLIKSGDRLWMSTNHGIFWVDSTEMEGALADPSQRLSPVVYTEADGMPSSECNGGFQSACTVDTQGRMVFPTQRGLARVDPSRLTRPTPPKPQLVAVHHENQNWNKLPRQTEAVDLRPTVEQRDLHVRWTAPALRHAEDLRFRYRLKGYDDRWHGPTTARTATWTQLPPRPLELEIQVGIGALWGPPTVVARVHRAPTFTETHWFLALLALAGVVGVAGAVYGYTWRLRARETQLENLVSERTRDLARRNEQLASRTRDLGEANRSLDIQAELLETRAQRLAAQAERLEELDELKNAFVANVSHELRTPLTLVHAAVREAQSSPDLDNRLRHRLNVADRNATHLAELVEQLLEIAQLEAGAVRVRARRVDFGAFVRRVASRFTHQGSLRVEVPADPIPIYITPDMVDKVVANLLGNAFKFSRGGEVSVRLEVQGDDDWGHVAVTVTDNGVGIAPEDLEHIWQRFRQADHGENRAFEGTGLGLAIAREIVELHGGTIQVQSVVGQGTSFTFFLPLGTAHLAPDDIAVSFEVPEEQAGTAAPLASAPRDSGHGDRVILLVEDHPDMRAYIADHLCAHFTVIEARDGQEALTLAREHRPDAVVSDIMMPVMDGMEMSRRLREEHSARHLPILLVSAKGGADTRLGSLDVADDFLEKPFLMPELLARVGRLLEGRARQAEASDSVVDSEEAPRKQTPTTAQAAHPQSESERRFLQDLDGAVRSKMDDTALSMEVLASQMAMSRRAFYRAIKKATGSTPGAYLRNARLAHAQTLLERGTYPTVGEVAAAVGLTQAYLSRLYKARFGVTPGSVLRAASPDSSSTG